MANSFDDMSEKVSPSPITQGGTTPLTFDNMSMAVNPKETTLGQDINEVLRVLSAAKDNIKNMSVDELTDFVKRNGELPGGLGGSIAGSILGFLTPIPGGALIGSVLVGALGTAVGSLYSDSYKDEPYDIGKAASLGTESAAFDVGTLGAGKLVKGGYRTVKGLINKGRDTNLKSVAEVATQGSSLGRTATPSKSTVSPDKAQSQMIAQQGDATLTPFQLGGKIAKGVTEWKERIGRTGTLGKLFFDRNLEAIKEIGQKRMDEIIDAGPVFGKDGVIYGIGHGLSEAFSEAGNVLVKEYGEIYAKLANKLSSDRLKSSIVTDNIDKWVNRREFLTEAGQSRLDDDTMKVVNNLRNLFFVKPDGSPMTSFTFKTLLDIEHELNKQVNKFGTFGSGQNLQAARELVQLSKRIKVHNRNLMRQKNPEAAKEFIELQNHYGKHMNSIYPKINQAFIKKADAGSYSSLGSMFLSPQKADNVRLIMKSIDDAYKVMGKEGATALPFKTAKEAKQAIRTGYIEGVLPKGLEDAKDFSKYVKLQEVLKSSSDETAKIKLIMGEKYTSFKRTVDLLANSSKNPTSGLATLFFRTLEIGAVSGVAALTYNNDGSPVVSSLATAAAVLGGPAFLARMATNPKYVNQLIKLDKLGKHPKKLASHSIVLANKVLDDMVREGIDEDSILSSLATTGN